MSGDLGELTSHCIRCGFCLESCPTFKITGDEAESPRGRIYLARSAHEGKLDWSSDVRPHIERCLGCRACETACPSGVEYGQIFEIAKARLEEARPNPVRSALLHQLTDRRRAVRQFKLGKLLPGGRLPRFIHRLVSEDAQSISLPEPMRPRTYPPLGELPTPRGQVALLRGCVMDALFAPVHEATIRLLRRMGFEVVEIRDQCCGAMHAHSGDPARASQLAHQMVNAVPVDIPILTNSAGCGSTMKEYGHLDASLTATAIRFKDVSEFFLDNGLLDLLVNSPGFEAIVTYHDACHLVHGQGVAEPPRTLLKAIPGLEFVELEEASTCCGSAGTYNVLQPTLAKELLNRKWKNVQQTGATWVASGNPGCHAWLQQASRENQLTIRAVHTVELLEASFSGLDLLK